MVYNIQIDCVVPKNTHLPSTEGTENSRGGGMFNGLQKMKLNWNFQRGGEGGLEGRYGHFLEPH